MKLRRVGLYEVEFDAARLGNKLGSFAAIEGCTYQCIHASILCIGVRVVHKILKSTEVTRIEYEAWHFLRFNVVLSTCRRHY